MDNLCHTLVGAALGEAGLKRRTRYGNVTLMVASNIPDIDVLVFATGLPAVAFRRGWTHGLLAQLVLPALLAGIVALVSRWRARREAGAAAARDTSVPWLLALSYLGVLSHVSLDYLNNYGIRLLAPFDWRWFYGDAVFIVDVWLWAALGAGVWLARRRARPIAAGIALAAAICYVAVMLASARAARSIVSLAWQAQHGQPPAAHMVGPVPLTPLRRTVIVDAGDRYVTGTFSWPRDVALEPRAVPKNDQGAAVSRARAAPGIRGFLVWSRFPYWEVRDAPGGTLVTVRDMRFGERFSATALVTEQAGSDASHAPDNEH
jgi:inner membrane protein